MQPNTCYREGEGGKTNQPRDLSPIAIISMVVSYNTSTRTCTDVWTLLDKTATRCTQLLGTLARLLRAYNQLNHQKTQHRPFVGWSLDTIRSSPPSSWTRARYSLRPFALAGYIVGIQVASRAAHQGLSDLSCSNSQSHPTQRPGRTHNHCVVQE